MGVTQKKINRIPQSLIEDARRENLMEHIYQLTERFPSVLAFENACDLTHGSIARWRCGYGTPSFWSIFQICKTCDVSADWLMGLGENE